MKNTRAPFWCAGIDFPRDLYFDAEFRNARRDANHNDRDDQDDAAYKQQAYDQQRQRERHKDAGDDLCRTPSELERQTDGLEKQPDKNDDGQ